MQNYGKRACLRVISTVEIMEKRGKIRDKRKWWIQGLWLLVIGAIAVWWVQQKMVLFPIQWVKVSAKGMYLDPLIVKETVTPNVRRGFFGTNVVRLQQELARFPWVQSVEVQRVWPDGLVLRIQEMEAVARFGRGFLNAQGTWFYAKSKHVDRRQLPILEGPIGREKELLFFYQKVQDALRPIGLEIEFVSLSERDAWLIRLTSGLEVVLGRQGVDERLRRFRKIYPELQQVSATQGIERIDLRYHQGMAIRWKQSKEQ